MLPKKENKKQVLNRDIKELRTSIDGYKVIVTTNNKKVDAGVVLGSLLRSSMI